MLNERTLIKDLAGLITASGHFARAQSGALFRYTDGVYAEGGEFFVRQEVKHLLLEHHVADRWSRNLATEVIEFILLDAPELEPRPPAALVNLENGILDIWSGELLPHSPRLLTSVRVPVHFDPQAKCPNIEAFIGQVFPPDSNELAWELLGDLLTPDRSIQKAICLIGEGGNGKGVFLQLAANFVGPQNVAHLSLQRLEQDRFAVARLDGKLANICGDLPGEYLVDNAVFKGLTGGDRITGELKYRDSFEFTPFCRLLFSANHLPAGRDASRAYFDRWLIVPFEARFRGTGAEIPRQVLDARLANSVELSGVLNRALPALRRIRREGRFSLSAATQNQIRSFERAADPCELWLRSETTSSPTVLVSQERLYSAYTMACLASRQTIMTRQMFGRKLKRLRPDLQEGQRVLNGKKQWVYLGIALREEGDVVSSTGEAEHPIHSI